MRYSSGSPLATPMQALAALPLLQVLTQEEWEKFSSQTQYHIVAKQEYIYKVHDPSDQLFFLLKGSVKIGTHSSDGREVIKQLLQPVTIFGELGLVGEGVREDFAMAMHDEVHLYRLPTIHLQYLCRTNHQLSIQLLNWVGDRLRQAESRLEALICKDARQRIIDFLVETAQRRGQRVGFETLIRHSLTQQDIANITGTSRQTVTSVLNDLRKSNLIHFNRRSILIRDVTKLG